MTGVEFVAGDGWISDESSFYGDDETRAELEDKVECGPKRPYQTQFPCVLNKKMRINPQAEAKTGDNVIDFSKSRPQDSSFEKTVAKDSRPGNGESYLTERGEEAADLIYSDRFKSHPAAWQQTETIHQFLKRLPVADPATADLGPWLWVSSPKISQAVQKHRGKEDVEAFVKLGGELLHAFRKRRSHVEAENPDKAPTTITRKMGPYRDQLEADILGAAINTSTTCGKWMLFPGSADLPRIWRVVAEATSQGRLGPVSKVGTYDPFDAKDETLICVYTYNFADMDDVIRVLHELLDLGLCSKDDKTIYYKCDAYTYLGITSDNSYKLRASLFSSKELFGNEAKLRQEGPIARLRKRNISIDSFLSS